MPPSPVGRSRRATLLALVVALCGVLALDGTALVAAPTTPDLPTAAVAVPSHRTPGLRLLRWAGRTWLVAPPAQPGPDNDAMTDAARAVYVDARGHLHLRVIKVNGVWRSVELLSLSQWNYGRYDFVVRGSVSRLARPLDLGMFLIRPSRYLENEIDLESSRALSGLNHGYDSQFVVQPYYRPHHRHIYKIRPATKRTTQSFVWKPSDVRFTTRAGRHGPRLSQFHFHGRDVPTNYEMYLHINLFMHGKNHSNRLGPGVRSVVLEGLQYRSLP